MRPDILVVGQGIAGTLLAWELERAGLSFALADAGHASATSCAGAGIINPITGRRVVKSWRVDELLPLARTAYRNLESELSLPLWREMRIRRLFADDRERQAFAAKQAAGVAELAPFAGTADEDGFWIEGAARVDVGALLGASRARWKAQGRLHEAKVDSAEEARRHGVVIDCTGLAGARSGYFETVPWEFSKGELLEISVHGLEQDVVLNRRHWILPVGDTEAWIGATHEPGIVETAATPAARALLEASARAMLNRLFMITGQRAGVRVTLPDKLPVAGRQPGRAALGLINALGAKGALLAPMLAQQWVEHLARGRGFDPAIALDRFEH